MLDDKKKDNIFTNVFISDVKIGDLLKVEKPYYSTRVLNIKNNSDNTITLTVGNKHFNFDYTYKKDQKLILIDQKKYN